VRPSGTEPKIKYYFAVKCDSIDSSREKISLMINEMKKIM